VFADELARARHVHFKQAVNDVSSRANRETVHDDLAFARKRDNRVTVAGHHGIFLDPRITRISANFIRGTCIVCGL
jgi:hypothetical protein